MKINFRYETWEVTAYIGFPDGSSETPCTYCGKNGLKQLIEIERVEIDGQILSKSPGLGKSIADYIHDALLHDKRAICEHGGACEDRFIDERWTAAEASGIGTGTA